MAEVNGDQHGQHKHGGINRAVPPFRPETVVKLEPDWDTEYSSQLETTAQTTVVKVEPDSDLDMNQSKAMAQGRVKKKTKVSNRVTRDEPQVKKSRKCAQNPPTSDVHAIKGSESSPLEVCHNVPHISASSSPPPSSSPSHPPSPALATSAHTRGLHPAFMMHTNNRSYFPAARMFAMAAGVPSPVLPSSSPSSSNSLSTTTTPQQQGCRTPGQDRGSPYEVARNGRGAGTGNMAAALAQAYARTSQAAAAAAAAASDPTSAQTAASLAYAAHLQQEGFPYGLSGVPAVPNYSYNSQVYGYATNGFPRKSRICSYCQKQFTRSTTRRYHENRCPLAKAAQSLMDNDNPGSAQLDYVSHVPKDASRDRADSGSSGGGGAPPRPPPLIAVNSDSPPPPAASTLPSSSSTSSSSATSAGSGFPPPRTPHTLNSSSFYSMYGSHSLPTTVSTSNTTPPASRACVAAQSDVDQNRNSVLPAVKRECEAEVKDAVIKRHLHQQQQQQQQQAKPESEDLLKEEYGSVSESYRPQRHNLSPVSVNSHSPAGSKSDDEVGDNDKDDEERSKLLSGKMVRDGPSFDMNDSLARHMYMTQLAALQTVHKLSTAPDAPVYDPNSYNASSAAEKIALADSSLEMQRVPSDREEGSLHDGDSSYQEEENLDHHSPSQADLDESEEVEVRKNCGICKAEFHQEKELIDHERSHQKYKPNSCRYCGQRFIKPSMRIAHQRLHASELPHCCVVCGLQILSKFGLRQHVHRMHCTPGPIEVACRYCKTVLESAHDLRQHFRSHGKDIPSSERGSIRLLLSPIHARSVSPADDDESQEQPPPSTDSKRSGDSPGMQSEGSPVSGSKTSMSAILAEGGPSSKVNGRSESRGSKDTEWCALCKKELPKSFMRHHEREHAHEKPYKCTLCPKRFGYRNNMKCHLKLHTGIKPYQCEICLAKFTRGSTLRRHARRHDPSRVSSWNFLGRRSGDNNLQNRVNEEMLKQAQAAAAAARVQGPDSSPIGGSRALKVDPMMVGGIPKADLMAAGNKYDMRAFPASSSMPQALFNAYPSLASAVTQTMFPPYVSSQQYLNFATGFPPTVPPSAPRQQEEMEQSDALDFSMPEKQRQRRSSSSASAHRPRSASSQSPDQALTSGPTPPSSSSNHLYLPVSSSMDGRWSGSSHGESKAAEEAIRSNSGGSSSAFPHHHPRQRASLGETVERLMETRTGSKEAQALSFSRHDVCTQVTMCCAQPAQQSRCNDPTLSPAKPASSREAYHHLSIADLMTAGRLFRCPHCDCYFTDRAMYEAHQRIHVPDRPFVCIICQEDCQDKTTFSTHMLLHLR